MPNRRFRAAYDFQGDKKAAQLSFSAGDIVDVDHQRKGSGGWVWGNIFGSARNGWCPESYLVLHKPTGTAAPAPSPGPAAAKRGTTTASDHPSSFAASHSNNGTSNKKLIDNEEEEINDGFSGPIMGGSASDEKSFRQSAPPGTCTKDNDTLTNPFA